MSDSKTNNAPKAASKGAPGGGANRPGSGHRGARNPQRGPRTQNVDDAIEKALKGRVNVTPAKAVEMAGQLYSRGQYAPAARVCQQVIESRPANADAHNILGVTLAAMGRNDEAIESIKRAIKVNANAPSYHANLGEILRQSGRTEEAEAALKEAIRLDPNNPQALNNLGITQYEQRKFKEAVEYYRRALEARPSMSEALNNLGNALRVTGDVDGARSEEHTSELQSPQ